MADIYKLLSNIWFRLGVVSHVAAIIVLDYRNEFKWIVF